ncbi:MAG: beta-N-acetylhexosaminidase [Bacillota bacterium]|nr:beta-N-acetylhexosaminidase [Bacillota bacterium]
MLKFIKILIGFIIMALLTVAITACSDSSNEAEPTKGTKSDTNSPQKPTMLNTPQNSPDKENEVADNEASPDKIPQDDPINTAISKMTLDEKIGQLVIAGIDGTTIDSNARSLIDDYHVGGIILFKDNIQNAAQALELINSIKETNLVNKLPIFVSVDEEGGRVTRMPDELKKFPSSQAIGKKNNEETSYKIGAAIGKELKQFGFNLDFAPVLDIFSNPKNKVIGDRAFGKEPELVKKLGVSTMKGLQDENIISVVKHFPGHGDTLVDSHKGLPVVNYDLTRLNKFELIPFREAIKNNADAVMAAHILLPKIDPLYPASLSKNIITNILREEMGFDGVVMTDDLTMGAIEKNYKIENAAVKSINAGCDETLVCHDYKKVAMVIGALKKAVEEGTISTERLDQSVYRIIRLKNKYNLKDEKLGNVDVKKINEDIKEVLTQGKLN